VVSIQGLISRSLRYRFADLTLREILALFRLRDAVRGVGPLWEHRLWSAAALREANIIQQNQYFIGRTNWDRTWLRSFNPKAKYYHCNEAVRDCFFPRTWSVDRAIRGKIVFTGGANPSKGIYTLLDAMVQLRTSSRDCALTVVGDLAGRHGLLLRRRIQDLGLEERVTLTGPLGQEDIVQQLLSAEAFVSASYIDNSPLSVAEALVVGVPLIASFVGGVNSMVQYGRLAALFPAGDPALLAERIAQVLDAPQSGAAMGHRASAVSRRRHYPMLVARRQMQIYREILGDHRHNCDVNKSL
jgi:glycosyltransferase involved in cell wall biosynthesis